MSIELVISPQGHLLARKLAGDDAPRDDHTKRILTAFAKSSAHGLLHLATAELQASLPPAMAFARDLGRAYLTRLCHTPGLEGAKDVEPVAAPPAHEFSTMALQSPPMVGAEYLTGDVLAGWWSSLDGLVREEIRHSPEGAQAYLQKQNPLWRLVGRVTFHLAENKRDTQFPFAFMATYASQLSAQGRVQHQPLGKALEQYSGTKNKPALLSLLTPIQRAAEKSALVKELVDAGDVYHPLAWTPRDAYRFLQEIPAFEESGLIVRVPDWWKDRRPSRPVVNVKVGGRGSATLGTDALLEFSASVALDGESLDEDELQSLLAAEVGLVMLKGKWVEVDREKLKEALTHWKRVERETRNGGISFFEGMRLLAGVPMDRDAAVGLGEVAREWTGITLDAALEQALTELRDPAAPSKAKLPGLRAELRPYQQVGVHWLRLVTRLGLGACLADDMGLGKTVQVIALLLHRKRERSAKAPAAPSLLVVPASLIANWKAELCRFAPELTFFIAHPSESTAADSGDKSGIERHDLVITTYNMLSRLDWLRTQSWDLAILDEAQAIKNSGTRQTRAVKELHSRARIALTGTPVENRLADLWSLFDFLNPGLLGGASAFGKLTKRLDAAGANAYGPLRTLVRPYLLRRLKTDKRVIADLPEKTEVPAYCPLSKRQVALYEHSVRELAAQLKEAEGIQRRGLVLSHLMRLKQICNHPSHALGDGRYEPKESGKFARLAELCEELAERQEKALIFTQFREITQPLAEFLAQVFTRPGLVLHGGTSVARRRGLVDAFQRDDGPPFFVLSLKAGGTGLNLTAASHVVHFDRWWNPAVENQATDRAFRIGQKRNVMVHKFVCRGTVEEKIDEMMTAKSAIAKDVLEGGGEMLLTEMNDEQLLKVLALDVDKALES